MFHFDPTIKLGDLLTVFSFIGFGIGAFYNIKNKLDMHNLRLTNMETALLANVETLKLVATQEIKIQFLQDEIKEIKASL